MYISKLKIKNFKCFDEVEINFDPNFNLIIGENNSGKSTIFEALRLWQLAFNKFLKDRTNNQSESSFYSREYYSFTIDELNFLRIDNFKNLFFRVGKTIELNLTIQNNNDFAELPLFFTLNTEEQNLRFNLCLNKTLKSKVSDYLLKVTGKSKGASFKDMLLMSYINPIFHIPIKEPKYQKGYILEKLHQAKANEVIRNLIEDYAPIEYQTSKNKSKKERSTELFEIEKTLHEIILNKELEEDESPFLNFSSNLKPNEDVNISLFVKNNHSNTKVEISQLGSGTINIINILAVLSYGDYESFHLTALLLDEPDSHLHSNNQEKLYKDLIRKSKDDNKQIFVITHNHELISCSENVLFVDPNKISIEKKITSIPKDEYFQVYKKIAVSFHEKMIEIAQKREIEEQIKEITKPTIFCEGNTDVTILKSAFSKLYDLDFFNNTIDIKGEGGASRVNNHIQYSLSSKLRIIGLFDRDKEGKEHFDRLQKDGKGFILCNDFHINKSQTNIHGLILPIPDCRNQTYFNDNLFIEYLFSDDALIKCGVEMERIDYMNFDTIKLKKGKDSKKDCDIEKNKIIKNIDLFSKEDFKYFVPLFEKIAEIINFSLPEVTFDA